jgi:hypothetical protein
MFNTGTLASNALNSLTKAANSAANSTTSTLTTAVNSTLSAVNSAVNSAATTTTAAINSAATTTVSAVNSAVNSVAPAVNSLMPFNNSGKNASKNSGMNNFRNVFNNSNSGKNAAAATATSAAASSGISSYGVIFGVFLFLVATFLVAMFVFKNEFEVAWNYLVVSFRKLFKMDTPTNETPEQKAEQDAKDVTTSPPAATDKSASLLDKILPMGSKEVFNVSLNDYTFYDAEPLCMALGAELARYEQVKEAWNKGGDWCNYGWTKGQLAIYPTQKETWDKLQGGPADEKSACGRPGVNGGYFDNPEMRFGVNCYGIKPDQSANDERILMENGTIPKTASTLKMDKQIQDIKNNLDMVGILPFNSSKWSA